MAAAHAAWGPIPAQLQVQVVWAVEPRRSRWRGGAKPLAGPLASGICHIPLWPVALAPAGDSGPVQWRSPNGVSVTVLDPFHPGSLCGSARLRPSHDRTAFLTPLQAPMRKGNPLRAWS